MSLSFVAGCRRFKVPAKQDEQKKSGRRRRFKEKNIKRVGKMCVKESE